MKPKVERELGVFSEEFKRDAVRCCLTAFCSVIFGPSRIARSNLLYR